MYQTILEFYSMFTTDFLQGLMYKYHKTRKQIYVNAVSDRVLLRDVYAEIYRLDYKTRLLPFIYERAVKLGRRGRSPYNQHWGSELMYS